MANNVLAGRNDGRDRLHTQSTTNSRQLLNARSQQFQGNRKEANLQMNDDELTNGSRRGDGLKQARLHRAQEYLDQVVTAQTKSQVRKADNRSFITHKDLLEMQDKIHDRSNTKRDKSMPQDARKTSENNLLAGH